MTRVKHHGDETNALVKREFVRFKAARSHKPGGMNRDHRATKIQAWIKVQDLPLTLIQKKTVRKKLAFCINKDDEIFVESEETRSQETNKDRAVEHLNFLVESALREPLKRIPSEPTRKAKEERISEKKIISRKKKMRREGRVDNDQDLMTNAQ